MIEAALNNPMLYTFLIYAVAAVVAYFRRPVPVLGEFGVSAVLAFTGSLLYVFAVPNPSTGLENVVSILAKGLIFIPMIGAAYKIFEIS